MVADHLKREEFNGKIYWFKMQTNETRRTDLYLKSGSRALDTKCNLERKPGIVGERREKLSDYALQLREKQKSKDCRNFRETI